MEKLLVVKDLAVSFKTFFGEVEAVRGINFHVNKQEIGRASCRERV